jgi:hypothetical protein
MKGSVDLLGVEFPACYKKRVETRFLYQATNSIGGFPNPATAV